MIRFDYQEPTTLKRAFSLMEKHGDDGRVIAGGTALLIMMRQRLLTPKVVISLARIPKFDKITFNAKDGLRIGAGVHRCQLNLRRNDIRELGNRQGCDRDGAYDHGQNRDDHSHNRAVYEEL